MRARCGQSRSARSGAGSDKRSQGFGPQGVASIGSEGHGQLGPLDGAQDDIAEEDDNGFETFSKEVTYINRCIVFQKYIDPL